VKFMLQQLHQFSRWHVQ